MNATEIHSRREIFFENYRKIKNIEARTMLEMTMRDIIPAVSRYIRDLSDSVNARRLALPTATVDCEAELIDKLSTLLSKTYDAYNLLDKAEKCAMGKRCDEEASIYYKDVVEQRMSSLRRVVDEMEILTSRDYWPMPTYGDIMFRV
jgi:glutamine synthetase